VPNDPERSSHDGVVELYFEDMAALTAAFDSETGREVQADAAEFADMEAGETLYVEERVEFEAQSRAFVTSVVTPRRRRSLTACVETPSSSAMSDRDARRGTSK